MRTGMLCAALLVLTACAADTVRLERAGTVSTQARAVTIGVNAYVADVQARRREANVALVASDASCDWGDAITVDTQWNGRRGLCDVTGLPAARRATISLRPVSAESLRPIAMSVAGVATFQAALAEILDTKPVDARAEINGAIETLSTAASDINRIAGEKLVNLGPLTSDRGTAVAELVGTLVELQQTNLKVRRVAAIVDRVDTARLYDDLRVAVTGLRRLQDGNSADGIRDALDRVYARDAGRLDFTQRRDLVRQIAAARDEAGDAGDARLDALTDAIDQLASSDVQLRRALAGEFTPEVRRSIARENRKQAFGLLTKIAALFPAI